MDFDGKVVASIPPLLINDWNGKYYAILRATSKSMAVVSVGKTVNEVRERAYQDISHISNQREKARIFGEVLDINFGDELILRDHVRVFLSFCDYRTYRATQRCGPKNVYVGIDCSDPLTVSFVKAREVI